MYHLGKMDDAQAAALTRIISALPYVYEAVAIAKEGMLIVKIKNQYMWDEKEILEMIGSK